MYKGYRPTYTNTSNSNQGQLNALLERIQGLYKQAEFTNLMFLIDMSMQNYGKSMLRLKLPQPTINDNLTNTIHEKLMTVKSKNRELTIKMLNLQATIAKNNSSSRRSKYESQYTRNMQMIRESSYAVREKLVKLNNSRRPRTRVMGSQTQRSRKATNDLKQLTETLSHETIKMRTEFSTIRQMFPDLDPTEQ